MGAELLRGEFRSISRSETLGNPPQKCRIFFRDVCFLLWPQQKPDVCLAQTARISDRMARYLLNLTHPPSERVREAVLDEVRQRFEG